MYCPSLAGSPVDQNQRVVSNIFIVVSWLSVSHATRSTAVHILEKWNNHVSYLGANFQTVMKHLRKADNSTVLVSKSTAASLCKKTIWGDEDGELPNLDPPVVFLQKPWTCPVTTRYHNNPWHVTGVGTQTATLSLTYLLSSAGKHQT